MRNWDLELLVGPRCKLKCRNSYGFGSHVLDLYSFVFRGGKWGAWVVKPLGHVTHVIALWFELDINTL